VTSSIASARVSLLLNIAMISGVGHIPLPWLHATGGNNGEETKHAAHRERFGLCHRSCERRSDVVETSDSPAVSMAARCGRADAAEPLRTVRTHDAHNGGDLENFTTQPAGAREGGVPDDRILLRLLVIRQWQRDTAILAFLPFF